MGRRSWSLWTPKAIWKALEIDNRTILQMLKGGLPPTIVIAMYAFPFVCPVARA